MALLHDLCKVFQSTLPRGERQSTRASHPRPSWISIHAPTRGATQVLVSDDLLSVISIHAPTRGATVPRWIHSLRRHHFNPRSHEGSDDIANSLVSAYKHFNPRSHEGSDDDNLEVIEYAKKFQSTLPRGERPLKESQGELHRLFQSTLPRGERQGLPGQ